MSLRHYMEAFLTSAFLLIGAATTMLSLAALKSQEAPDYVLVKDLVDDTQYISLMHSGGCAGELRTSILSDRGLELHSSGVMSISYERKVLPADFKLQAYFNPLGQLIEGMLEVKSLGAAIELKINGILPLKLHIKASGQGKLFERSLEVPGPLLIVKRGGKYQIEYTAGGQTQSGLLGNLTSGFSRQMQINILNQPTSHAACLGQGRTPLDISDPLKAIQNLILPFSDLIPAQP